MNQQLLDRIAETLHKDSCNYSVFLKVAASKLSERRFEPAMAPELRATLRARWARAVEHAKGWVEH